MRALALPLTALVLVLPGCSDDGGDAKAEYVREGEHICEEAQEAFEAQTEPTSVEAVPAYIEEVLSIARTAATQFRALEPPEEDAAEIEERVLDPLDADLAAADEFAEEVSAAAQANDSAALIELVQNPPEPTVDIAFVRDYGFETCAEALAIDN
jgi:hypothetical protein